MKKLSVIEICAGGGGQAIGLEKAGFEHEVAIEIDRDACLTLQINRPQWNVIEQSIKDFNGTPYYGVDLLAGGVPCPPFSIAGQQLGQDDDRDLFPDALRLVKEIRPRAVLFENVRGLAQPKFEAYRESIISRLKALGYRSSWTILDAANYGVVQTRNRFILIALRNDIKGKLQWPTPIPTTTTVGELLYPAMSSRGWQGALEWSKKANGISPTIVGGSKKHGGPDLGPTRARRQWAQLGVNGIGIANEAPGPEFPFDEMPKLTVSMVAKLQGFPDTWSFAGKKTSQYRQVGNAFPPPVAEVIGLQIYKILTANNKKTKPITDLPLFESMTTIY